LSKKSETQKQNLFHCRLKDLSAGSFEGLNNSLAQLVEGYGLAKHVHLPKPSK